METERMGRCARKAWEHAVESNKGSSAPRPGVTTGHLLLGVLKEQGCAGGLILRKLQLDLQQAYSVTEFVLLYGRPRNGPEQGTISWAGVSHTRLARMVLDFALEEANLFSPTYPIGTEHLLLGLLRAPEGIGGRVLQYFGIQHERARAARDELWKLLRTAE